MPIIILRRKKMFDIYFMLSHFFCIELGNNFKRQLLYEMQHINKFDSVENCFLRVYIEIY